MKGAYVLLLQVLRPCLRNIGSLGVVRFEKGTYCYAGSAQSSLFPRLERHYSKKKQIHWHIDYLTTSKNVKIEGSVYSTTNSKKFECRLSIQLSNLSLSKAIPHFGSTDCKKGCGSHLYLLSRSPKQVLREIIKIFRELGLRPYIYHAK